MRRLSLALLLVALTAPAARAHILLNYPPPRSNDDGLRNGPCGGVPATEPTAFEAGETIEVRWLETIPHEGSFWIAFSENDGAAFEMLLDDIENPDRSGQHNHSQLLTLPNRACDGCVLQLGQVMLDYDPVQYYYACADITLALGDPGDADPAADVGTQPDLGTDAGGAGGDPDASSDPQTDPSESGRPAPSEGSDQGCSVAGPRSVPWFGLLALVGVARRRSR